MVVSVELLMVLCHLFIAAQAQYQSHVNTSLASFSSLVGFWPFSSTYNIGDARLLTVVNTTAYYGGVVYAAGPYGLDNTSISVGTSNRYVSYSSPLIHFINDAKSFSITMWVNVGSNWQPFIEWRHPSNPPAGSNNPGMHMSQYPGTNSLWFNTMTPTGVNITCNGISGSWMFVGMTYSYSSKTVTLFCNEDFLSPTYVATSHPISSTVAYLGHSWSGNSFGEGKFACLSMHTEALDIANMIAAKSACKYYSIACTPSCTNGGTCVGYNVCACQAGFTGIDCSQPLINSSYIESSVANLPAIVAYWPLTADYGANDAKPTNKINGVTSRPIVYAYGPYGRSNTARKPGDGNPKHYIVFDSPSLHFESMNQSWTIAFWAKTAAVAQDLPFFEYHHTSYPLNINSFLFGAHAYHKTGNKLRFHVRSNHGLDSDCIFIGQWQFSAVVFDRSTATASIFCNDMFRSSDSNINGTVITSNRIYLGMSWAVDGKISNAEIACMSAHNAALTTNQLWAVRDTCRLFSPKCAPACQNGGSCVGYNRCVCRSGWTGRNCGTTTDYLSYLQMQLSAVNHLIAYWPFTRDFEVLDAHTANQIHGYISKADVTYSTGPFTVSNTAISIINSSQPFFISFENEALNKVGSSYSIATWIKSVSSNRMSFFDFYKTANQSGLQIMQFNATDKLYFNSWNDAGSMGSCAMNNQWRYIGITYFSSTDRYNSYCLPSALPYMDRLTAADNGASKRLYLAQRYGGLDAAPVQYACASMLSIAYGMANHTQLSQYHCNMFSFQCPEGCLNGGTCIADNTCSCSTGFTGLSCGTTLEQMTRISAQVDSFGPSLVGYWPLSADFGVKDAKTTNVINGISSTQYMTHAHGPFGGPNTALDCFQSVSAKTYFLLNDSRLAFNGSWTWAGYIRSSLNNLVMQYALNNGTRTMHVYMCITSACLKVKNVTSNDVVVSNVCAKLLSSWTFIAVTYNIADSKFRIYCDTSFLNLGVPSNPLTLANRFALAYNFLSEVVSESRMACFSAHSQVIDELTIDKLKLTCRHFYQNCSQPCQNGGTCIGYDLCSCAGSWRGDYCETQCHLPCENGGSCRAPDVCDCPSGWSGYSCEQSLDYELSELKALAGNLPGVSSSFWPLSSQFGLRDGSTNLIDGMSDGNSSMIATTGPFGFSDSALITGNSSATAYIKWANSFFSRGTDSWTLTAFVKIEGTNDSRSFFEWYAASGEVAQLWRYHGVNTLYFTPGPTPGAGFSCNFTNNWAFIAVIVSPGATMWQTFCNNDFAGPVQTFTSAPITTNTLQAGYRDHALWGKYSLPVHFSCVTMWHTYSNLTQLLTVKSLCPYFHAITCGPGCAPNTCRPRIDAALGYLCDSCNAGWTGSDCATAICNPLCSFNQFCAAPNSCSCNRGWSGNLCDQVHDYRQALRSINEILPKPVAYYPFNKYFSFHDSSGSGLHAVFMPGVTYTQGPLGINETAVETSEVADGYIYFNYSEIDLGNNSFTIAMFAHLSTSPFAPLIEWSTTTALGIRIWQFPDANSMRFWWIPTSGPTVLSCSASSWKYFAAYFNSNGTCGIWCDATTTSSKACPFPAVTIGDLRFGVRLPIPETSHAGYYRLRTACYGIYNTVLSQTELKYVALICQLFSNFNYCPANCAPGSCYGNLTSPSFFSCSSCDPPGFTGPQCDQSACSQQCSNGGTCMGSNICGCAAGWTGPLCETFLEPHIALMSLRSFLPSPIAYWPLNKYFGVRDASGSSIDAVYYGSKSLVMLADGPDGVEKNSYEMAAVGDGVVYVNNAAINVAGGSFSISFFAHGNGLAINRFIDFENTTATFLSIGHHSDAATLSVIPHSTASTMVCNSNDWKFIAFTYNSSSATCKLICDLATSISINCTVAPKLSDLMYLGARLYPPADPLLGFYKVKMACVSMYSSSLSEVELAMVRNQCQLYSSVCLSNCAVESCYGNSTSATTFSCVKCKPGWVSDDCNTPTCVPSCANGGTCSEANKCSCIAAFTV